MFIFFLAGYCNFREAKTGSALSLVLYTVPLMWGKCQMHVQLKAESKMMNDVYCLTEGHAKMLVFLVHE